MSQTSLFNEHCTSKNTEKTEGKYIESKRNSISSKAIELASNEVFIIKY